MRRTASGRDKPKRAEKARQTRARLLEAATAIVGEQGYAGATIAGITARAEVAQGTFYNYFASRQAILDELLPALGLDLLEFVRTRIVDIEDPAQRETARLVAFFDYLVVHPHFYRILNEAEMFAPAAFAEHMRNMVRSYRKALAHDVASGGVSGYGSAEIEAIVYMLLAARNYLSMRYSYRDHSVRTPPAHVIEAYAKLLVGGLFTARDG